VKTIPRGVVSHRRGAFQKRGGKRTQTKLEGNEAVGDGKKYKLGRRWMWGCAKEKHGVRQKKGKPGGHKGWGIQKTAAQKEPRRGRRGKREQQQLKTEKAGKRVKEPSKKGFCGESNKRIVKGERGNGVCKKGGRRVNVNKKNNFQSKPCEGRRKKKKKKETRPGSVKTKTKKCPKRVVSMTRYRGTPLTWLNQGGLKHQSPIRARPGQTQIKQKKDQERKGNNPWSKMWNVWTNWEL